MAHCVRELKGTRNFAAVRQKRDRIGVLLGREGESACPVLTPVYEMSKQIDALKSAIVCNR